MPPQTLRKMIRREKSERRLIDFVRLMWHALEPESRRFVEGWHIGAICEHLEAVTDGEITKLLMNVPPGSMKSMLTDVFWPLWEWGPCNMPATRYFTASYSQKLTIRDNQRFLAVIQTREYQEMWGDRFTLTHEGADKIMNDRTGWKLATSTGGLGTGERGDRVIVDDPHNVIDAESEIERQNAITWFSESLPLRINDPLRSAFIVIMQRVHEEDISGHILAKDLGYTHLMIPMEFETDRQVSFSPLGWKDPRTEENELYWPHHFTRPFVDRLKFGMGRFAVASQLQQSPMPKGGNIIREADWQVWPKPGTPDNEKLQFPSMEFVLVSVDTAMTEKEENDESAITVWGIFRDWVTGVVPDHMRAEGYSMADVPSVALPRVMLKYAWSGHLSFGPLVDKIQLVCKQHACDTLLIEGKVNGFAVQQEIVRLNLDQQWSTELQKVDRDKIARAYSVQHFWEQGVIYAPQRDWADKVIAQCAIFPKGKRKDLVDSTTQAIRYFREMGLLAIESETQLDAARRMLFPGNTRAILPPSYDI